MFRAGAGRAMTLSVKSDPSRIGGGYAVLTGERLVGVSALSVQNCFSGLFLDLHGRWSKTPLAFPVEAIIGQPQSILLGPEIVDHIATDLQVAFGSEAGEGLGFVSWEDILPRRKITIGGSGLKQQSKPEPTPKEKLVSEQESELRLEPKQYHLKLWAIALGVLAAAGIAFVVFRSRPQIIGPRVQDKIESSTVHVISEKPITAKPPIPPPVQGKAVPNGCSTNASDDLDRGLQKYAGDDRDELVDAKLLLKCALASGKTEAKFTLGRLYIKMANVIAGSYMEKLGFYEKACEIGDQEGCQLKDFQLH